MKQYRLGGGCAAIAGAAMLLLLGALPAHAQAPGGTYLQSCTNIRASGDRVSADCRRRDGSWDRTALHDLGSCVGDIGNRNGRLTCSRHQGYGSSYQSPPSYRGGYDRYDR